MQFKHPELLYALFLLLIPIIVHLFQLRKFKTEYFTNVAFLKQVQLQTRKSAIIKKWLTLFTRLLILACLIFAFAQPYLNNKDTNNKSPELAVYLDNSFSMQAKGKQGVLLKRAIQELVNYLPENQDFHLITNTDSYRNTTLKNLKKSLLQLKYSNTQLPYQAVILKAKKLLNNTKNTTKHLVFISDFQVKKPTFSLIKDTLINIHTIKLKPENINNISVDSLFISKTTPNTIECKVRLSHSGNTNENVSVALYNNKTLVSKINTEIENETETETTFNLPANVEINGLIKIEDNQLQFDNTLFFNINKAPKINILAIGNENTSFLKRIYTPDEFNYTTTTIAQLNFNAIAQQHTIVLNELKNIPVALSTALNAFCKKGGHLIIIPAKQSDILSYNNMLTKFNISPLKQLVHNKNYLTTINYEHSLYASGVFEKKVKNFQYPKVNSFFPLLQGNGSIILQFQDKRPFLLQHKNVYIFTAALNKTNSNFKNINLIVPTFYNMAKFSLKQAKTYYTIGKENRFDVTTSLQQDAVLSLENNNEISIPQQHYFNTKVEITTTDLPSKAGIYTIKNKIKPIAKVSYNYSRKESVLNYYNTPLIDNSNTISSVFNNLKNENKTNSLWKWFSIFALVFLILEMLILNFFK